MEIRSILVPVSGTEADSEAMVFACRLAKKDKARIVAVYVIPIQRSLPLDAELETEVEKGERVLEQMEKVATGQGYAIETDLLQAREEGPAIVDEAREHDIDLILMGTPYQRQFGQFSLGQTIVYVLKNAPCRVMIYHHYPPPEEDTP